MTYELQDFLKPLIATVLRRMAVLFAILISTLVCLSLFSAGAARAADTSELCGGYAGCSVDGFTTNGYQHAEYKMWWRMYPGDNCTNYAAYVESQVYGVPTTTYLLGDGGDWAETAAAHGVPVNDTPTVGSVAAWSFGSGADPDNHVGIVEAVGPDDRYVDVSQSGMGYASDGFLWERVYRNNSSWESWPSSFIHFTGSRMPGSASDALLSEVSKAGVHGALVGVAVRLFSHSTL